MADRLPPNVLRFLHDQIDSVPQLEALLLVWQSAPEGWREADLASRIYVSLEATQGILRTLAKRELVHDDGNGSGIWRFNLESVHAGVVPDVATSYRNHLILVSRFIHSKGSSAVREFARAFRFKDESEE